MIGRSVLAICLLMMLPSALTAQDTLSNPESIFFAPGSQYPVLAKPGDLVDIEVQGVSQYIAHQVQLEVPLGVMISRGPACNAHVLLDPVMTGNQRATSSEVYCSASTTEFDDHTLVRAVPTQTVRDVLTYNVYLTLSVRIPSDAMPGLVYEMRAPVAWLGADPEVLSIEVSESDGARSAQRVTPTPPAAVRITAPPENGNLTIEPRVMEASPGEVVSFDLFLPRSATWEMESFAFLAFAEESTVMSPGPEFRDMDGHMACTVGSESDLISPASRAVSLLTNPLPRQVEVAVGTVTEPGRQLLVCVEMVGLGPSGEVFSWNTSAIIVVR